MTNEGWDTCPPSLVPLASLALKVLLNTTQKVKCHKELWVSVVRRSVTYKVQLVIVLGTLFDHLKRVLPSSFTFFIFFQMYSASPRIHMSTVEFAMPLFMTRFNSIKIC